ncbi:MAG: transcriptional regulator [Desulfovibrio fairfieldensis]|nr:transcriptional regulator [Desulfovibrio fairfieldensis]
MRTLGGRASPETRRIRTGRNISFIQGRLFSGHPPFPPLSSALEIRCFGNLAFRLGDAYLRIGNKKAAELLAYLLCHGGEPIPKQHLAGLLWPRVGGRQALDSLYKVCAHIGALEYRGIPLRLRSSGGEIQLDCRSISCDLFRFDALYQEKDNIASCHTLLDIYAGPLLQTQGYDWLAPWEARYELRYVEILTSLLSHYERSGDATRAGVFRKKLLLFSGSD